MFSNYVLMLLLIFIYKNFIKEVDYGDVVNYAQDQIGQLVKLRWMLESTLEQHQALAMMNLSSMK